MMTGHQLFEINSPGEGTVLTLARQLIQLMFFSNILMIIEDETTAIIEMNNHSRNCDEDGV